MWLCSHPYFQNRIIMFCLSIRTLIYLWEIYIFPGSVCLFCCNQICGPILGIFKSLADTLWKLGLRHCVQFPEKEYINRVSLLYCYTGHFNLENKQKMLIYENEHFRQEINTDQKPMGRFQLIFRARFRPHQTNNLIWDEKIKTTMPECFHRKRVHKSYLFQNKLILLSTSRVWNKNERFRLVFTKCWLSCPKKSL